MQQPLGNVEDEVTLARRIAAAGAARDAVAEERFCRRFGPRIRLFGLKRLRSDAAASDLAQDVLILVLDKRLPARTIYRECARDPASRPRAAAPVRAGGSAMKSDETLLAWWLDELDEDEALEVEAHLFECDQCGARLRELLRLRAGVREALSGGEVAGAMSRPFIDKLRADGLRVREYHLEAGGSVACTVAPEDDLVVSYLRAPLAGVRQLDVEFEKDGETQRATHIPFDAEAGEVAVIVPTTWLKTMGAFTQRNRLYAVTLEGERLIGEYTFNHSPWEMGTVPDC